MMYHNPHAVVQVNGRRSRTFAIELSVGPAGLLPVSSMYLLWSIEREKKILENRKKNH